MKRWTRIGYAFGFAVVVGALTVPVLALISRDLLPAFFDSRHYWFQMYWLGTFVLGYLLAPAVNRYFESRRTGNPEQSTGYLTRCAYAIALTIAITAIVVIVLALVSKDLAYTFIYDYYFAAIFVIAFSFAPAVDRYVKSQRRSGP